MAMAKGCHLRVGPARWSHWWGEEAESSGSKRDRALWLPPLHLKPVPSTSTVMAWAVSSRACSTTTSPSTCRGGHVYGQQCAQGVTMKQTLKNCMASLVGDLMQAASAEVMLDMRHVVPAKWCKHQAGPGLSHGGKQSPIGTSLSDE